MRAIEFIARIRDGVIEIPDKYRQMPNQDARVIILTEEKDGDKLESDESLQEILSKLSELNTFGSIDDPSDWQRSIRDDWS